MNRARVETRGALLRQAYDDRWRHHQWLAAAGRGGTCGLHRAECLALAAAARRRLAATLAAIRAHDEVRGRARRAAHRRRGR